MKEAAPKGMRLHIGIFGRRNVGKSTLLNAVTRQNVSIVSEEPGTTTDPVEKAMELLPLGPVLFIDTAGIDDVGVLGELRVSKTAQVLDRTDLAVIVSENNVWGPFEEQLVSEFRKRNVPIVAVLNKIDLHAVSVDLIARLSALKITPVQTALQSGKNLSQFRQALLEAAPDDFIIEPNLLGDIVGPGQTAVLVVPIDKEAPRGRLILPQVRAIRNLLDTNAFCLVLKESGLQDALRLLRTPPRLIVTDSQAFREIAAHTPPGVLLTSFSILMARAQGDLAEMVHGALAIENLKPGNRILVAESCTHHPVGEDIGRVKIPRWLTEYVGGSLEFETTQGRDFPQDLSGYNLVVHCGGCMTNRRQVLSRIALCREQSVPITNYGLAIAYSLGIFERALEPFPALRHLVANRGVAYS